MNNHKKVKPPKLGVRFIKWYCKNHLQESILGDLEERFYDDMKKYGMLRTRIQFWLNAVRFINGYTLSNNYSISWNGHGARDRNRFFMIPNYFAFAFRILNKQRVYSLIKICGLGLSLSVVALVALYIHNEFSFDRDFENHENIYRVQTGSGLNPGSESNKLNVTLALPFAQNLAQTFPEIAKFSRITRRYDQVKHEDFQVRMTFRYVDKEFLNILKYPLINGSRAESLTNPNSIVLTRSSAEQIFHTVDCIGEFVELYRPEGWKTHFVTAVVEDPASNMSIDFNGLVPITEIKNYNKHEYDWNYISSNLFIELHENADTEEFRKKLLLYSPPDGRAEKSKTFVTPLAETHFDQSVSRWAKRNTKTIPLIMGSIALVILILAAINYMLMMLSTSLLSIKEYRIRKVMGAKTRDLQLQLIIQTLMMTSLAFGLGVFLTWVFLPHFNNMALQNLEWNWLNHLPVFIGVFFVSFLIGLIASFYPILKISKLGSYMSNNSISGKLVQSRLSSVMISVQLFFSIFFLSSGYIMQEQLSFMLNKDMGFDEDNILVVSTSNLNQIEGITLMERFRAKYSSLPEILDISGSNSSFGRGSRMIRLQKPDGTEYPLFSYIVDWNYLQTMDMDLKEGRAFLPKDIDRNVIIVNESFEKEVRNDNESILGSKVLSNSEIIGVVRDFHFLPLTESVAPVYFSMDSTIEEILVRVKQNELPQVVNKIKKSWNELETGVPFEHRVLGDQLSVYYKKYQRWGGIMSSMAVIGFIISCMGMFGLWGVKMTNKTKEIGIRKVNGAGILSILKLLNREVMVITIVSAVLTIPFTLIILNNWLNNFAYKITINWSIFAFILIVSFLISLFTVSFHTIRTALINPATILRSE